MGEDNVPQPQSSACIRCLPILMCSPTSSPRHPSPLLPPPHSLSLPLLLKSLSRSGSRTKMWSFWAAVAPPPHAFRRKRVKSMALRLLFLFLSLSAIYADEGEVHSILHTPSIFSGFLVEGSFRPFSFFTKPSQLFV